MNCLRIRVHRTFRTFGKRGCRPPKAPEITGRNSNIIFLTNFLSARYNPRVAGRSED
jgi:hypothetical protein